MEIVVKKNARVRYTTIQNWSNNVYNLVTQRATCEEGATMEWVDGNIGSKRNMKYPAVFLLGPHARGEALSIAVRRRRPAPRHRRQDGTHGAPTPPATLSLSPSPVTVDAAPTVA